MELSKEILNTIDGLADRFGLAIDWSKDNIYPQVADVMERFVHYKLINYWAFAILGIILLGAGAWLVLSSIIEKSEFRKELYRLNTDMSRRKEFMLSEVPIYSRRGNFVIKQVGRTFDYPLHIDKTNENNLTVKFSVGIPAIIVGLFILTSAIISLIQLYVAPEMYILEWIANTMMLGS